MNTNGNKKASIRMVWKSVRYEKWRGATLIFIKSPPPPFTFPPLLVEDIVILLMLGEKCSCIFLLRHYYPVSSCPRTIRQTTAGTTCLCRQLYQCQYSYQNQTCRQYSLNLKMNSSPSDLPPKLFDDPECPPSNQINRIGIPTP